MHRKIQFINTINEFIKKNNYIVSWITLLIGIWSIGIAWNANNISRNANKTAVEANNISVSANVLAASANGISTSGNSIINTQYSLEKIKFLDERWKNSIQVTSNLYDKLMDEWSILNETRIKVQNKENINIWRNLERYVDQFEFIGHMYCEWFIRKKDIKANLKWFLEYACNNTQIYDTFRKWKNAAKHLCFDIVWNSKFGSLYEQKNECTYLDDMMYQFKDTYKNLGIPIVF